MADREVVCLHRGSQTVRIISNSYKGRYLVVDLLDLACLQPVHVDVDAIYLPANVSLVIERRRLGGLLPSLRLPELPNSAMVAVSGW